MIIRRGFFDRLHQDQLLEECFAKGVTPLEMKVLRRVCAQFNTGIRKPFVLKGKNYKLIYSLTANRACEVGWNGLRFEDVQNRYNVEKLREITPEAILTAINMFEVRTVMES